MLFCAGNFASMAVAVAFVIISMIISKIPFKVMLKSVKPIIPLILFTAALNLFFMTGEKPLFEYWVIRIYPEGVKTTVFMVIRVVFLILGSSLLTYTTSPVALTDALERLLSPLKAIKFPVHELSMMMTIALRFIPTLVEETDKIMSAQKARGADMETGGLLKRAKALVPIMIPLFISAFKRAEELALAMECRCYRGGEGRTRLRQLKAGRNDYAALALELLLVACVISINILVK